MHALIHATAAPGRLCDRKLQVSGRPAFLLVVGLAFLVGLPTRAANAALTFDLRAVSGSQVTIHGPKSVGVTQNSVGGWIDFELYAVITGNNSMATDEAMQNFVGRMLSTHIGRGAAVGSMINTGEVAPRMRQGVRSPFDGPAYQDGTLQNLDSDPELEIGGTETNRTVDMIAARTGPGGQLWYEGHEETASLPLYRFTLPIESVPSITLEDMTAVSFSPTLRSHQLWYEDGHFVPPHRGSFLALSPVLIHTADTPEELAMIPEPGTWLLGVIVFLGLALALRRVRRTIPSMNRTNVVALTLVSILSLTTATSRADLTFDLRAVSGSQIVIHGPKSVAVNQNSVGGWIDFELWALLTGHNDTPSDEGLQNFAGRMLSTHLGHGAIAGSMVNAGEIAPGVFRGIQFPFDKTASSNGWVQNLDDDPELEIGGTEWTLDNVGLPAYTHEGFIAGRGDIFNIPNYAGANAVAEFLTYRFTLPIEAFTGNTLTDITQIHFGLSKNAVAFFWLEDGSFRGVTSRPRSAGSPVLIHTAQTPEELALIPEPGTWALALAGLFATSWLALRRRN